MPAVVIGRTPPNPSTAAVKAVLRESFRLMGGIGQVVKPGARVLLKPNAGVVAGPETARNTDPRLVEALIGLLQEAGAGETILGEASVVGTDTMAAFQAAGLLDVAHRTGSSVVDLKKGAFTRVRIDHGLILKTVRLASLALEADVLINLPKLKTICAVPVSIGLKNLKGLLPDREKKRFHHTELTKAIVDLNRVIRPHLTIVDGIIAHEMYEPRETNLILAGRDILAVDTVACAAMGIEAASVPYLALAREAGLGEGCLERIDVKGIPIEEVCCRFATAPDTGQAFACMFPEVTIADGNACTGCSATLYLGLKNAKTKGILPRMEGLTFAIGQEANPASDPRQTIYLGNCLRRYNDHQHHFLPGCPFTSMEMLAYLEKRLLR